MTYTIWDPMARFYLEGTLDSKESIVAVVEFYSSDGERAEMRFTSPDFSASLADMLFACSKDLYEGQEFGIQHILDRKGHLADQDFSVEDIVDD